MNDGREAESHDASGADEAQPERPEFDEVRSAPAGADETLWHVYILRCADGTLYTGIAKKTARRLSEHNAGQGARYTRSRLPVQLVYEEKVPDRGSALRREHEIKRMSAAGKHDLIKGSPA